MQVADNGARRQAIERRFRRVCELTEQVVDVERDRRHQAADPALPAGPRAVGVDLDPVAVRVGEVDRLADRVVGEAVEAHVVAGGVGEPAREVGPGRHEQGEVEEAGVAVGRPRAGLLDEPQELAPTGPERGAPGAGVEQLEPDRRPVVGEGPLELRDGHVHRAGVGERRDLGRRGSGRLQLLRVVRCLPADLVCPLAVHRALSSAGRCRARRRRGGRRAPGPGRGAAGAQRDCRGFRRPASRNPSRPPAADRARAPRAGTRWATPWEWLASRPRSAPDGPASGRAYRWSDGGDARDHRSRR